ncbi:MAG TPA: helix-turn-helix domain-containing protein, partial [Thermoanaerobaculia bacterium]|nr:helix-turn-helix domain-containing protein [Thermoanaerobaculia bacterium]
MQTKRGRGRPRGEGADEVILAIALEMLTAKGYRELTVDAVAERAGVAKTTVYRRWPSKGALVAAAIAPMPHAATSVEEWLRDTRRVLQMLADADGDIVGVVRAVLEPRRPVLVELLGGGPDAEQRADELIGVMLTRLLIT